MGRRKERRAAASMASGRRVKLDLFAEPLASGEKTNQGDGEGVESREEEKVLNSSSSPSPSPPSSPSGKRQDNPLLLLGQYSDEEPSEELTRKAPQIGSAEQNAQVEEFVARICEDENDKLIADLAVQNVSEVLDKESAQSIASEGLEGNEAQESGSIPLDNPHREEEPSGLVSDPWTSGMQSTGEVAFGWKLVMHEESNQYYYWNVETGETSWEMPAIFAQGTMLGTEQTVPPVAERRENFPSNADTYCSLRGEPAVYSSVASVDQSDGAYLISNDEQKSKANDQVIITNERHTYENLIYPESSTDIHQTDLKGTDIRASAGSEGLTGQPLIANDLSEGGLDLSTRLVSYAESLIQRLKGLEGSHIHLEDRNWISNFILEIEIRLSDINSLFACGSSLLPFWMHSEEKLKGLERVINDRISQFSMSGQANESHGGDTTSHGCIGEDSELNIVDQAMVCNPYSSLDTDTSVILKEADDKAALSVINVKQVPPSVSYPCTDSFVEGNIREVDETALPKEPVYQPVPSAVEDEDMDVDMEVDDETTDEGRHTEASGPNCFSPSEHFIQPDQYEESAPSVVENGYDVPPLPDDDWIPPPPPDAEPIPPPPPDDPPTPTHIPQPPCSETVDIPCTEQYNMSYPVSGTEYYVSTMTEVPNSNYYAHSEEPQVVTSQTALFSDMVSTTYSETASDTVNPVNALVYYGVPSGSVCPVPSASYFDSSGLYGESNSVRYHEATADPTKTLKSLPNAEGSSVLSSKDEHFSFASCLESDAMAVPVPSLSTRVQAATSTASMPSTTTASGAVAPSTNAAKPPTKVLRSKKRTIAVAPTLRSNKKVSSLVDKWKAAKEELLEDEEDEPLNPYEMLERKRQREIEEWKSHQIATGEAKDNANFQPLGGDWRERVKRRRAKSVRESTKSLPDVPSPTDDKQPSDLTELSKDLPSGWQAYWDESTKKAYYGNTITMETTWTKPIH